MKVKTHKKCKECGKEFKLFSTLDKFCTKGCLNDFWKRQRKKIRDKKSVSISTLSKVADKLWSQVVRLIWKCEYCGKHKNLNAHHIFSRSNKKLRWSLINWVCLCSWCHVFSSEFSAHKTPTEFTYWLEEIKGKSLINELIKQKQQPFKVTSEFLQEIIKEFKEILKNNAK